ncbi:MAG: glycosyltransferase family 2 protein [Bacteroidaceae bacterium]
MKVSIVTATFNSVATLQDAMDSVFSQDYPNIEYIIIDGESTDGTMELVRSFGKKVNVVVSEPDKGLYDAMNKGIKLATGDIIGILNSDDFFTSNSVISQIVEAFEANKKLDGVHGDLYYVDAQDTSKIIRYWHTSEYRSHAFFKGWHPAHPTLYLRREVYEKFGVFDLRFPLSADFELMLRFFECCKIKTKHLNLVMIRMRIGGATSRNLKAILRGIGQCNRAFRVNGLCPPLFYTFYRLCPKLLQYVRK